MATRFYFRPLLTASPIVGVTPDSGWELNAGNFFRGWLTPDPRGQGVGSPASLSSSATTSTTQDMLIAQYISDPLPAGTLDGTFKMVIAASEADLGDDGWLIPSIRVVSNNGSVVRGIAFNGAGLGGLTSSNPWQSNYELGATSNGLKSRYYDATALGSVGIQAGDRIVVEIGVRFTGAAGSAGASINMHDKNVVAGNRVFRPWIEFSKDLFAAPTREQYRYLFTGVMLNTDAVVPFVDITKVDGLDNAPVSLAQNAREGMHGGYVTSSYQTQRTVILEGDIYASPSNLESYLDTLKANFRPTKAPHPLFFGTDTSVRMVYGKSQGLRYAKDAFRRLGRVPFMVQIVCADPRIYAAYSPKAASVFGAANLNGNRDTYPRILFRGGMTNPSISVNNMYGTQTIAYTGVLSNTDYVLINCERRTALLNGITSVRHLLTISDWPVFSPDNNSITTNSSVETGGWGFFVDYLEAYE
jgi:hypothetical protein